MRTIIASLLLSTTTNFAAMRAEAQQRPAVVELFTSEGCSSCPPAEAYLGELAQRPDVLALAFHVDYWDGLGWHDRFVIPEATPRQRGYARSLGLPSMYTPQVVIDGTGDFVGSDRGKIMKALEGGRNGVPVRLTVHEGSLSVELGADTPRSTGDITLIAFERAAVSSVGRGENAGRTLHEYNIVRAVRPLGHYRGAVQTFSAELGSLPEDATDVAVIVQAPGQRAVLGAARLALRPDMSPGR